MQLINLFKDGSKDKQYQNLTILLEEYWEENYYQNSADNFNSVLEVETGFTQPPPLSLSFSEKTNITAVTKLLLYTKLHSSLFQDRRRSSRLQKWHNVYFPHIRERNIFLAQSVVKERWRLGNSQLVQQETEHWRVKKGEY